MIFKTFFRGVNGYTAWPFSSWHHKEHSEKASGGLRQAEVSAGSVSSMVAIIGTAEELRTLAASLNFAADALDKTAKPARRKKK